MAEKTLSELLHSAAAPLRAEAEPLTAVPVGDSALYRLASGEAAPLADSVAMRVAELVANPVANRVDHRIAAEEAAPLAHPVAAPVADPVARRIASQSAELIRSILVRHADLLSNAAPLAANPVPAAGR